jgi:hypothetical protein
MHMDALNASESASHADGEAGTVTMEGASNATM